MDNQVDPISESLALLLEGVEFLEKSISEGSFDEVEDVIKEIENLLLAVKSQMNREKYADLIDIYIPNAQYSVENVKKLLSSRSPKLVIKIEFELYPLLQDLYQFYYYFSKVHGDIRKEKKYLQNEAQLMGGNAYCDQYEKEGKYKYDLSIVVLAFNEIKYTKLCIESLLENIPSTINYELISVNNGSEKETKDFFDELSPTKQIDLKINGINRMIFRRIIEGKYFLFVSNDVYLTPNSISNMLKCIESDEKTIKVVPTTTNVSNFQTIKCDFSTMDEMKKFSIENNKSNKYRWEQRVRLVDPISLQRSKQYCSSSGFTDRVIPFANAKAFPDDAFASIARRNGFKLVLAKDAFCHHFGSITYRQTNTEETLNKGRKYFYDIFDFDPWGKGFCYDIAFVKLISKKGFLDSIKRILGVDPGMGSNPLKLREFIKEVRENNEIGLDFVVSDKRFIEDLKSIGNQIEFENDLLMSQLLKKNYYEAIVIEKELDINMICEYIEKLSINSKNGAKLFIKIKSNIINQVINKYKNYDIQTEECEDEVFTWLYFVS